MRGRKIRNMSDIQQGDIVFYKHGKRQGHIDPAIVVDCDLDSADLYVFCHMGNVLFVQDVWVDSDGNFVGYS